MPHCFDPAATSLYALEDVTQRNTPVAARHSSIDDLAFLPVTSLAPLIQRRDVSATELTKMYLERLNRYNKQLLNTVTFLDELGMQQAKAADAEIAAGKFRSVLHGIPWGAKDIIAVKGYPTTWGSASMKSETLIPLLRKRDITRFSNSSLLPIVQPWSEVD